ncbi:NADPH:quinone reductase [Micromonospora globispora]|uniref:NADPH:quinone reductase n=1 Tax=Micromonospora globispora TaxID=1450148 RepID=A0A317K139_9ACTN|nr:NADP-dependent oxidoreductase [Micromonospora globispora]PWU46054.1 NADPH:quinone reductase [Micromonospora globispora]PWU60840.1 NADPH:quinone reductase [Micromonospora globispora]RQW95702.1 NADPH:quinone reductase [Micromonospora globispora]
MRAIEQDRFGGPDVLKLVEVDRPEPGAAEVLVRVHAVGVNPTDFWHRETGGLLGRPVRLGWDLSGVVEAVGVGAALFRPGDEVFGMPRLPQAAGTYAEYVTAPSRHLARKPAGLSHVEAAGLGLAGLTAWQALVDIADVRPGQRVLVHAAAGGVGHLAVQIAKARGAHVIGTASAAKHAFVRGLGADEVIDYTMTDFADRLHDLDVVLDSIGGEYGPRSLRTLRPDGILVALASPAETYLEEEAARHGKRARFMIVEPDGAGLTSLAGLVDTEQLRVEVDTVLPLEQVAKAHEIGQTGRTKGKVILTL